MSNTKYNFSYQGIDYSLDEIYSPSSYQLISVIYKHDYHETYINGKKYRLDNKIAGCRRWIHTLYQELTLAEFEQWVKLQSFG